MLTPTIVSNFIGSHLTTCPPKEATKTVGTYYRLLKHGILNAEAFISRAKLGVGNVNSCNEWAVSLTVTLDGAKKLIQAHPKNYKEAKIAQVKLNENSGVAHQNKVDHVNWWHPDGFDPLSISSQVDESPGGPP